MVGVSHMKMATHGDRSGRVSVVKQSLTTAPCRYPRTVKQILTVGCATKLAALGIEVIEAKTVREESRNG